MAVGRHIHACLRRIARYVAELHASMIDIVEDAGLALGLNDLEDEP